MPFTLSVAKGRIVTPPGSTSAAFVVVQREIGAANA